MNWHRKFSVLLFAGLATLSGHAQTTGKYLAPRDQLVAIRAGRLFDARSGTMLTNQVVIVRGDRITEVGSGLAIPSGANVIDLSNATVMPGMIDAHVHINPGGESTKITLLRWSNMGQVITAGVAFVATKANALSGTYRFRDVAVSSNPTLTARIKSNI